MDKKTEALKLALEALESFDGVGDVVTWEKQWRFCHAAITALRQALEQQPADEPVALETVYETIIHWDEGGGKRSRRELARRIVAHFTPTPANANAGKPWVGLTDEEIIEFFQTHVDTGSLISFASGAEYAEAKLREKNS